MKKISKFDCGPAFAMAKVVLYEYNAEDPKSLARAMKFRRERGKKVSNHVPGGFCVFDDFRSSRGTAPIYIFVGAQGRKDPLDGVFRTLPHEIDHVVGFLCENWKIKSVDEPAAYLCGYMTKQFQKDLLKSLGYEIVKKEEKGK